MFLDLQKADQIQGDLFRVPDSVASQALMLALDQVNRRYGRDTPTIGRCDRKMGWKLRSEQLSSRFTTD